MTSKIKKKSKKLSDFSDQDLKDELERRRKVVRNLIEYQEFLTVVKEEHDELLSWGETVNDMAEQLDEYMSCPLLSERVSQYGSSNCDHEVLSTWERPNYSVASELLVISEKILEYAELIEHHVINPLTKDIEDGRE